MSAGRIDDELFDEELDALWEPPPEPRKAVVIEPHMEDEHPIDPLEARFGIREDRG